MRHLDFSGGGSRLKWRLSLHKKDRDLNVSCILDFCVGITNAEVVSKCSLTDLVKSNNLKLKNCFGKCLVHVYKHSVA